MGYMYPWFIADFWLFIAVADNNNSQQCFTASPSMVYIVIYRFWNNTCTYGSNNSEVMTTKTILKRWGNCYWLLCVPTNIEDYAPDSLSIRIRSQILGEVRNLVEKGKCTRQSFNPTRGKLCPLIINFWRRYELEFQTICGYSVFCYIKSSKIFNIIWQSFRTSENLNN